MDIKSTSAYIKGLAEGLGIGDDTKEGKVISALIELCVDMAEKIDELESECCELREYIEEIDSDLGAVEEELYLGEEDGEEDFDEEFEDDFDSRLR